MKTAGVKELKAHLSEYLREVQRGETVLVTDRGRVVAQVRPPDAGQETWSPQERRYRAAVERGLVIPAAAEGEAHPLWEGVRGLGLPRGTVQALLDQDRAERDL